MPAAFAIFCAFFLKLLDFLHRIEYNWFGFHNFRRNPERTTSFLCAIKHPFNNTIGEFT